MLTLGLESTCDETAVAVVENEIRILSNVVSSQIDLHAVYGGVVPELACRQHIDVIIPVIEEALKKAHISLHDIDLFAVAHGPGLVGALLIGLNVAKTLSLAKNKPLIGVNHIEAHLYAALMCNPPPCFPCLGIILSGGHTALMKMQDQGNYTLISQTVDDAIGESFDKVAKLMHLPYPGGPIIEELAKKGNPNSYPFKGGRVKGSPLSFSFSGLKTAVLYTIREMEGKDGEKNNLTDQQKCDIAASFQHAAFTDIINKTVLAAEQEKCTTLVFGGGVTNNKHLRHLFAQAAPHLNQLWPTTGLSLDNAAMIAGMGGYLFKKRDLIGDSLSLETFTRHH